MKRRCLRLFLALSLVATPFSPVMAAVDVMTDEDLSTVSARGFENQGVFAHNNFNSVQALGAAQKDSSGMSFQNVSNSSLNVHHDVASLTDAEDVWTFSKNCQYADNATLLDPSLTNYKKVEKQNNNQGSVQFSGEAQKGASELSALNAANSAGNVYQKLLTIQKSEDIADLALSQQAAYNSGYGDQQIYNKKRVTEQNNNNGSVQVAGDAQSAGSSMSLSNITGSAQNISQMLTGIKDSEDIFLLQSSHQYAFNDVFTEQKVTNRDDVRYQNNNNNSVQIAGNGQSESKSFLVGNAAGSAVNVGQNMAYALKVEELSAIQQNDQFAENISGGAFQKVKNKDDVKYQNNNNSSVQAGDYAQASSRGEVLLNAAASAVNVGQNLVSAAMMTGDARRWHKDTNFFAQKNEQEAMNGGRVGLSIILPDQINDAGQKVKNYEDAERQNNNFGSVQLGGHTQDWNSVVAITNAAASAVNVGQNMAFLEGHGFYASICQFNGQRATNFTFDTVQKIWNKDDVEYQNNNNSSVQARDNAQKCVESISLANIAGSAANIGQNIVSVEGAKGVYARQMNYQNAFSSALADQTVKIWDEAEYQNNNNGSVQLIGAQNSVSSASILNAAISAVNVGQNIAKANTDARAFVTQRNDQYALVSPYADQSVTNEDDASYQNNNNASVQLIDSQNEPKALSILNTASSAVNVGQNVALAAGKGVKVSQVNYQNAPIQIDSTSYIANGDAVSDQFNNNASVYGSGSGSQKQVHALSLANIARSAANIGQNLAEVDAGKWARIEQKNDQNAEIVVEAVQNVGNGWIVLGQNNNNGSVQGDDLQNDLNAVSIVNAAASAVNVGQNIVKADSGKWLSVKQINKQNAWLSANAAQVVVNDTLLVYGQNNNNLSVQLIDSQNNVKALSVANLAGSAGNIGQNVALLEGCKEIEDSAQVNLQSAIAGTYASQQIDNGFLVLKQNNNNGAVQLKGSQNGATAGSILNAAISAANIGQNIAKADAGWDVEFAQVNVQYASVGTNDYGILNQYDGLVSGQSTNIASVQLFDSQKNISGVSVVNAAASAVNVGQNIVSAKGSDADVYQVNYQNAEDPGVPSGRYGNLASVQHFGSQNGASGLSILDSALSAANIGQNVMSITNAKWADAGQLNKQQASEESYAGGFANSATVQLNDSENGLKVLSAANIAVSAANVGQNLAEVKAWIRADVDQKNKQYASNNVFAPRDSVLSTNSNSASVQLTGSQNYAKGLSIMNAAGSAVNVGQNIAKADAWFYADVDQVNCQAATIGGSQVTERDSVENGVKTAGAGSVVLNGSQNNASGLSFVNAAGSAVNIGQNIAAASGRYVDVDQVNFQCARMNEQVDPIVKGSGIPGYEKGASASSVQLSDSQMNMCALSVVNAVGSAVNVGQNIAAISGVRGGSITQMSFQRAIR